MVMIFILLNIFSRMALRQKSLLLNTMHYFRLLLNFKLRMTLVISGIGTAILVLRCKILLRYLNRTDINSYAVIRILAQMPFLFRKK